MKKTSRLESAIAVRDAAIAVVRANGSMQPMPKMGMHLVWNGDGIGILFRTPFQRLPAPSGRQVLKTALSGFRLTPNLPYGIDIWDDVAGKVFNFEWSDKAQFHIAGFRKGPWQEKLANLCASRVTEEFD